MKNKDFLTLSKIKKSNQYESEMLSDIICVPMKEKIIERECNHIHGSDSNDHRFCFS